MTAQIIYRTSLTPTATPSNALSSGGLTNAQVDGNMQSLVNEIDLREVAANKNSSNGYPGLSSFALQLKNAAGTIINLFNNTTTAIRTWTFPDKSGTVAMTSDIPASGTPNLTLGIANASGVATTHLQTDATILAFDTTAPTTQAFGDSAAVGSATVAARRDHKHAMPASTKDTTALTGILKGNGSVVSAAASGTDYGPPTSALATGIVKSTTTTGAHTIAVAGTDYSAGTNALATGIVKSTTTTGALSIAVSGTDYSAGTSALATGMLKSTTTTGALSIGSAGSDYVAPGTATNFTAQQYFGTFALTDGATISWAANTAQVAKVTLGGNRTMAAPSGLVDGAFYSLNVIQDGTGTRTLTWNTIFKFTSGVAPTLSTAASAKDFFTFKSDGTNLYEQGRSLGVA